MAERVVMSPVEIEKILQEEAERVKRGGPEEEFRAGHPKRGLLQQALADLAAHLTGKVSGVPDCGNPSQPIEYTYDG